MLSTVSLYYVVLVLSKDSTVPSSNTTNCKIKCQWNHITTEHVSNTCSIYPSHNKTPAQNHKWCKYTCDVIISAIHNFLYFSVYGFCLHSINDTYVRYLLSKDNNICLTILVLSKDSFVTSSNTTNCKIKCQWNHITTEQVSNVCTIHPSCNTTPAQNHKWYKYTSDATISAIHNFLYFSVYGFCLHSINDTYLCNIPTQQRQQYLPNLKKNIDASKTSRFASRFHTKTGVMTMLCWISTTLSHISPRLV